jgi:hypothetical protein
LNPAGRAATQWHGPTLEINMTPSTLKLTMLLLAGVVAALPSAHANDFGDSDIDPRFRAKIVKQKIKMKANEASNFNFNNSANGRSEADCGSQNIGNVDNGGKIGRGPREVFVFAPNAINLVSGRGCQ